MKLKAILLACIFVLSCLSMVLDVNGQPIADTVVIPVDFRSAAEVLPLVQHLLSPQGKASADPRSNSLVVTDTPERIAAMRSFLSRTDQPAQLVTVRVRFTETRSAQNRSVQARGSMAGGGWQIGTPGSSSKGVRVTADDKSRQSRQTTESFVRVSSGGSAYIVAGRDIPLRERWVQLSRRYAAVGERIVFQRVETGMDVTPFVSGRTARLQIVPRIGYVDQTGRHGHVRFAQAATELTVPIGQWVSVAGSDATAREVMDALLASGSGSEESRLSIDLMVEE